MCKLCEGQNMEKHMQETAQLVDKYGVALTGVFDPKRSFPNYAYTIGLTAKQQPELLIVGELPHRYQAAILNGLAYAILGGSLAPAEGLEYHDPKLTGVPCRFHEVRVDIGRDPYPGDAIRLYGDGVRMMQVLLPDKRGHWPDDPKFNLSKFRGAAGRGWTRKRYPFIP